MALLQATLAKSSEDSDTTDSGVVIIGEDTSRSEELIPDETLMDNEEQTKTNDKVPEKKSPMKMISTEHWMMLWIKGILKKINKTSWYLS